MNTIQDGIWSGILATGPMTMAMMFMQDKLPRTEKSPLPPATLTKEITGVNSPDLTMISHFGYGAACGVIYAKAGQGFSGSPVAKGAVFGLAVWAGSYLGLVPALGLRARASNMPLKRNALMVLAHLVWGASLGFTENQLRTSGRQMLDGARKAPLAE